MPTWQTPVPSAGYRDQLTHASPGQIQTLRMIPTVTCETVPFDVMIDHNATLIWSGTVNGPAMQCGDIVNDAFESLGMIALRVGADGLYSVRLTTAVDHGWMYVTATATATMPRHHEPPAGRQPR